MSDTYMMVYRMTRSKIRIKTTDVWNVENGRFQRLSPLPMCVYVCDLFALNSH